MSDALGGRTNEQRIALAKRVQGNGIFDAATLHQLPLDVLALAAEIERLATALRPFWLQSRHWLDKPAISNRDPPADYEIRTSMASIGEIIQARAALAKYDAALKPARNPLQPMTGLMSMTKHVRPLGGLDTDDDTITPAMIEAGLDAFASYNRYRDTEKAAVERIYRAMLAARFMGRPSRQE